MAAIKYTGTSIHSPEELIEAGHRHWLIMGRGLESRDNDQPDTSALVRWAKNYYRHALTDYDQQLDAATKSDPVCSLCDKEDAPDSDMAADVLRDDVGRDPTPDEVESWCAEWREQHVCIDPRARMKATTDALKRLLTSGND